MLLLSRIWLHKFCSSPSGSCRCFPNWPSVSSKPGCTSPAPPPSPFPGRDHLLLSLQFIHVPLEVGSLKECSPRTCWGCSWGDWAMWTLRDQLLFSDLYHVVKCGLLSSLPHLECRKALQVGKCCWIYVVEAVTLWAVEKKYGKKRSSKCRIFILPEHETERALWSFQRKMTSFHDWAACCHEQGFLSSFVPIGAVKIFLKFKKTKAKQKWKSPCTQKTLKNSPKKPSKIKPTKTLKVFCVAIEYNGFLQTQLS